MKVWGISGLMGAGKSTALAFLKRRGYPVVDADSVAREVVDPTTELGRSGLTLIQNAFESYGPDLVHATRGLDRRRMREIITGSPFERDRLEALLHPLILQGIAELRTQWKAQGVRLGFVEGSRLVESGYLNKLDGLIVITAPAHFRIRRIMQRDRSSLADVEKMMRLQDEARIVEHAQHLWCNDKDPADLEAQAEKFLQNLARGGL